MSSGKSVAESSPGDVQGVLRASCLGYSSNSLTSSRTASRHIGLKKKRFYKLSEEITKKDFLQRSENHIDNRFLSSSGCQKKNYVTVIEEKTAFSLDFFTLPKQFSRARTISDIEIEGRAPPRKPTTDPL